MTIYYNGSKLEYPEGSTYLDAAKDLQKDFRYPIVLVYENKRLRELFKPINDGAEVSFVTTEDKVGFETMRRSASMLFLASAYAVLGKKLKNAVLHFSVDNGFYYTLDTDRAIDDDLVSSIEDHMRELVAAKVRINKRAVSTEKARRLFKSLGMNDKYQLFETRMSSKVNIYELDGYQDYNYGFMTADTSTLGVFKLTRFKEGIVLELPDFGRPDVIAEFAPSEMLFRTQTKSEGWAEKMDISTVGDLNQKIINDETRHTILMSEALQESEISRIADDITRRGNVKFVMIAGPSSSGKTTFSQRLCIQLSARGLKPKYIGVDNYFIERDKMPVDENGKRDFEGLSAIDVKKFNEDMTSLLKSDTIRMPTYDFVSGKRVYSGETLSLKEGEILVIEGIHCLNDKLTESLPSESKYRIYISALTQLNIDEHNRVPTTDGRLIRRIIRDHRTRGYTASQTIALWEGVRAGEEKNIFPFQDSADAFFNSALIYEFAVLKTYAVPLLFQIKKDDPSYQEAKRLLKFLDYFLPVPVTDVPFNSILREFVGGGCFRL